MLQNSNNKKKLFTLKKKKKKERDRQKTLPENKLGSSAAFCLGPPRLWGSNPSSAAPAPTQPGCVPSNKVLAVTEAQTSFVKWGENGFSTGHHGDLIEMMYVQFFTGLGTQQAHSKCSLPPLWEENAR